MKIAGKFNGLADAFKKIDKDDSGTVSKEVRVYVYIPDDLCVYTYPHNHSHCSCVSRAPGIIGVRAGTHSQ